MIEFDDWNEHYAREASLQGWQLIETGFPGNSPLEIKGLEHATIHPVEPDRGIPLYEHDEDAVRAFRSAFESKEDYALLAFRLIRLHSPKEYDHWRMFEWFGG